MATFYSQITNLLQLKKNVGKSQFVNRVRRIVLFLRVDVHVYLWAATPKVRERNLSLVFTSLL